MPAAPSLSAEQKERLSTLQSETSRELWKKWGEMLDQRQRLEELSEEREAVLESMRETMEEMRATRRQALEEMRGMMKQERGATPAAE
jgi:dsDNA-specific endonuclease/ATPase MutS2